MTDRFKRVLVITGSGISAESGIPTFRGQGGYWRNLDPAKLATAAAFQKDPKLIWEWYRERREMIRQSQPNAAHQAVVQLSRQADEFLLLTQNVDDLHIRATWEKHRLSAASVVRIHGDIFVTRCPKCDFRRKEKPADGLVIPRCPDCGTPLRPGVVWFDEELPLQEVQRVEAFLAGGPCDLVLVIGTTASFHYIIDWARRAHAPDRWLIEINPEETGLSPFATEVIREPAAIALPRLIGG